MKKLFLIISLCLLLVGQQKLGQKLGADVNDISASKLQEKYNLATEIKDKYRLEGVSLVSNKIINSELDKYKGEPKDEVKVIIGDKSDDKLGGEKNFEPSIELSRWNEVSFKLIPDLKDVAVKDRTLVFDKEKIRYDTPKISFEMYEFTEGEGGYKYIWYLNEKPATNKIEFAIETSGGLDFFYQPALNAENKDPNLTCTETQCKDVDGSVVTERPVNVVGSYAVYHSTKGGMNDINGKEYKTGKAFHIYRPHIIDAEGKETWGNLHIENGIYSVEIPQDFLDKAVYPIKSNDEFGYHPAGGGTKAGSYVGLNTWRGSLYNSPANINTVTEIGYYCEARITAGHLKGTVVLHSDLTIIANGVGNAGVMPNAGAPSWKTSTFATPPTLSPSTDYVLSIVNDNQYYFYYDTGDTNQGHYEIDNNYTTPTNPSSITHDTTKYSIYATYTPAATCSGSFQIKSGTFQIKSGNLQIKS